MRPYKGLHVSFNGDGRTDRASLQPLLVSIGHNGRTTVRPYNRYSSRLTGMDALPLDTRRASLQPLLVSIGHNGRTTVRPYSRYPSLLISNF